MRKFKLLLSYDGTRFSGWQTQPNAISIQMVIEEALSVALREKTKIVGAGRTDAGVHAKAQVAHFSTEISFHPNALLASLNGLLPLDIRALTLEEASSDFHARYSAKGKIYRYYLCFERPPSPLRQPYTLYLPYRLDKHRLKKACTAFIGTHDFTSFSSEAHRGSAARNPVRTLKRLEVVEEQEELYLEFEAEGFLYKMVRNIAGTLLDVTRGTLPLEAIPNIFAARDRSKAGITAPPHGLILQAVSY